MLFDKKNASGSINCNKLEGYTLIELLIVISIMSIFLFIVVPRLSLRGGLDSPGIFVRELQKKLEYLNEKSILEKKVYIFNLDGDEKTFDFKVSEEGNPEGIVNDRFLKPDRFPPGLELKRVDVVPGGTIIENKVSVPFTPTGMMFSFRLYFKAGEKVWLIEGIRTVNRITFKKLSEDEVRQIGI